MAERDGEERWESEGGATMSERDSERDRWEYSIVELNSPEDNVMALNRLGSLGWELVSVVCVPRGASGVPLAYLKRRA